MALHLKQQKLLIITTQKRKALDLIGDRFERKSLTAISIICHEIGHAIQDHENYKPLRQRTDIIKKTSWLSRLSNTLMLFAVPGSCYRRIFPFKNLCDHYFDFHFDRAIHSPNNT